MPNPKLPKSPRILTTTVGSYPVPDWLAALPSEQAVIDATRVVFDIQRQAGIDLPTDGELYRYHGGNGTFVAVDFEEGIGGFHDPVR